MTLTNKIDFAVIFSVKNANPNGDPLNGNRPRQNYEGYGEVSDVCLKRKIRNRLQDAKEKIFVQSNDRSDDHQTSLHARYKALLEAKKVDKKTMEDADKLAKLLCDQWLDVRAFGQVFAFKGDSLSIGIRGPVTIQPAFSIESVAVSSTQITKSVNGEDTGSTDKASDTMGMKHRIDKAVYVTYGAVNTQLAEKTGFTDADAEQIKKALQTLFVNDVSAARPEGSMEVLNVIWWKHNSPAGQYSSAKVHQSLRNLIKPDGSFDKPALESALPDLKPEIIDDPDQLNIESRK